MNIFPSTFIVLCIALALGRESRANAILQPKGSESQALSAKSLAVHSRIDGAFARTTLTTIYRNPNSRRIEADFIYAAPKNAVVTGFAYWFGEEKVVARVAEKRRAARIYQYITSRQRDPALVEMIGKNAFRARIFPVEANQDLKIEIQLAQKLEVTPTGWRWDIPLQNETKTPLEKLSAQIQSAGAATSNIGDFTDGTLNFERENYKADSELRVDISQSLAPLRASLLARREDPNGDGFFALQLVPATALANPILRIDGIQTFDVLGPKIKTLSAGKPFVVFGRFKKSGRAIVRLGALSTALDFSETVEKGSAAASWWAQTRLDSLSENPKNQFAVVALSKRFGLVSKWTSWLAIPQAERKRFDREVMEADRWNASRAYAQAVARGDRKTARAQKTAFEELNQKLGGRSQLSYALNSELELVMRGLVGARYDKTTRAKITLWKKWQRNLQRAGAKRDTNHYAEAERDYQEIQKIVPLYVAALEANRGNSRSARQLKKHMEKLASRSAVRRYYPNALDDALDTAKYERGVQLAYMLVKQRAEDKLSPARERDLKTRLARLQSNSQTIASGERRFLDEKVRPEAQKLETRVSAGADLSDATREFEKSWEKWRLASGAGNPYHGDYYYQLEQVGEKRLASQVRLKRENDPQNVELTTDLQALRTKSKSSRTLYDLRDAWRERAHKTADEIVAEHLANGKESARLLQLQSQLQSEQKNGGLEDQALFGAVWRWHQKAGEALTPHVLAKTENSPAAREITAQRERLATLDSRFSPEQYDQNYYHWELKTAWKGRAHEVAYQLLDAQEKSPARIPELQKELERIAPKASNSPEAFLSWEKKRRDAGLPLQSPREYYQLRPGDPLISVSAPQDCARVVAIMPDGILLPLRFNAQNKNWEARFDVPTWASEGDYAVQILIVSHNGTRQKLTMHFAVDTSAPDGKATVENGVLRLETDAKTDRVSAFLQDGSRVELRRGADGIFSAPTTISQGEVRFVLTDKAHNRTEIRVTK